VLEGKRFKIGRLQAFLFDYQLQFVARAKDKLPTSLRTDADPIDTRWRGLCPIGFNGDRKVVIVQRRNKFGVELQERLSARADNEPVLRAAAPGPRDVTRKFVGGCESPTTGAVCPNEVSVAPLRTAARPFRALLGSPRPQVAACKAKKDGGSSGIHTLSLKRVKYLFDGIGHACAPMT
jgi:hypothetical protein